MNIFTSQFPALLGFQTRESTTEGQSRQEEREREERERGREVRWREQ